MMRWDNIVLYASVIFLLFYTNKIKAQIAGCEILWSENFNGLNGNLPSGWQNTGNQNWLMTTNLSLIHI